MKNGGEKHGHAKNREELKARTAEATNDIKPEAQKNYILIPTTDSENDAVTEDELPF